MFYNDICNCKSGVVVMDLNFFCAEWHVQTWDIDGAKMEIRRSCLNAEMITAIQPYVINNELHVIINFNWQNEKSPTFILRGSDARRLLSTFRVQVPLEWLQGSSTVEKVQNNTAPSEYVVSLS